MAQIREGWKMYEIIGPVGTMETTALNRPEYREESWRLEETCCQSNPSERPSANTDVKNSQGAK